MLFPLVPFAPGVPSVNRNFGNTGIPTIPPVTSDSAAAVSSGQLSTQWGLFTSDGTPALDPDSVVALDDFAHEFKLSTFPIEEGSFADFNKVANPFEGRFVFNKGGPLNDRADFMNALETIVADTNLYVLSTPEISYPNVNMPRYRYRRRSDQGFQLISVEITLQQVRIAGGPTFSNTQDPTANSPQNTGAVQPVTPTGAQVGQAQNSISPEGVGTLTSGPPAP